MSDLTPKHRLGILRAVLGFTAKELAHAKVSSATGLTAVISENYDVVRKCLKVSSKYPLFHAGHQQRVLTWVHDRFGLTLEQNAFTAECGSAVDFERTVRRAGRSTGPRHTGSRHGDAALDEMAVIIEASESLAGMDDPYADVSGREALGSVLSKRLSDLIERSEKVPPRSILGRLADLVPLCGGCGKGTDAFVAHKSSLAAVWLRRTAPR